MSVVLPCWSGVGSPTIGCSGFVRLYVLVEFAGVRDPGDPQRPPEGASPLSQCETGRVGV